MQKQSLAYAKYWRICLADADLGKGSLKKSDLDKLNLRIDAEFKAGRLGADLVEKFFEKEPATVTEIEITIRPYIFHSQLEHGRKSGGGIPEIVTPVVSQAMLDREGRISPNEFTVVPRDILEPLDKGSFAIGDISELDKWLADHVPPKFDKESRGELSLDEWHGQCWALYLDYIKSMFNTVGGGWPDSNDPYQIDGRWAVVKDADVTGASAHILKLYDNIRTGNPNSPLFDKYASEGIVPPIEHLTPNAGFELRLGHSSDTNPLADAQRDALTHQLLSQSGEILGVNGPPGTGKTTMLLSVVASHWVRAALNKGDPPVIAAASTNNQAVTNVIDAFAKDFSRGSGPFAGRWLPDIKSYGAYFPSASKEQNSSGKYQTRSFFDTVEDPAYFARAKAAYLKAAALAFGDSQNQTIAGIVGQIHSKLVDASTKLKAIETTWPIFLNGRDALLRELGADPHAELVLRAASVEAKSDQVTAFASFSDQWDEYLANEPWIYTLLSWFTAVKEKRMVRAKNFLKKCWPASVPNFEWKSIKDFTQKIEEQVTTLNTDLAALQDRRDTGVKVMNAYTVTLQAWSHATACLNMDGDPEDRTIAACDRKADTGIRFPAFLHATHYWEGMWLQEMEVALKHLQEEKGKKGAATLKKRWHRRMMLTPCVVSTFFMLPKEFSVSKYERGEFLPDYLYDFIDLLIVDEAGQVLPEVAGASFSLAKKALVIGDTLQIEPIWSMTPQVDIGNLIKAGVMSTANVKADYDRISGLGKSAASGSVMEIAQHATRYHYDKDLPRGMFLYEHRRCYDEIVGYCNELCYHNKLIPKRGTRGTTSDLPAMGYLHIDGQCVRRGGSRANAIEAQTIAAWIVANRASLESKYSKPIHEIVGVVTPFGGQVAAITEACTAVGIPVGKDEGQMTVGTVHSLQGAERLLVIFSPTYSRDADGGFIDRSPSMLNVGVSRAKDNFLVFGDMNIFNPSLKGKPRGLLASYLLADEGNQLTFS